MSEVDLIGVLFRVFLDLVQQRGVSRGGGHHQLALADSQCRHQPEGVELLVPGDTQLVKPAVCEVRAPDGVHPVSGASFNYASITQGDSQVILVVLQRFPGGSALENSGRTLEAHVLDIKET